MDNATYVGLSRQMTLRRELDIIANNIANSDTNGFKVESLITREEPAAPAMTLGGPRPIKFVIAGGVARNFGQGSLRRTDAPLDVAIDGQGFFKVTAQGGDRFTRDGHFRMDDNGILTTQAGDPVADDGGGQIALDPQKGQVTVAADGTVSQGVERVGKIGVYQFANLSILEKVGGNLYKNGSNQQPTAATDAKLRQSMLEGSNVQPITEITRMIEVSRAYEQIAQMMNSGTDLSRTSIQRLGRVQ
ncbi:MAG TPA: flagellar basal-body rod protein FlgF [Phenylobacterium sp.]|nr:flagellar basal-body rod protein FlgF [Phenylobacterium sp.]